MFPRLLQIGGFSLYTYGVLFGVAVIVGIVISVYLSQHMGIDSKKTVNLGIVAVFSGLLGAKALFFLFEQAPDSSHLHNALWFATARAGGVFSGGLVVALFVSLWYIRTHGLPPLRTCDAFAPALALAHSIGRLGCFAAGCCYGKPTSHFWGVRFANPLARELVGTPLGVPLEPTQLFESAAELANFCFLYWLFQQRHQDGQVMGAYVAIYGAMRFFLEFLRGDPGRGQVFDGAISGTQLIAFGLVLAGLVLCVKRHTRNDVDLLAS